MLTPALMVLLGILLIVRPDSASAVVGATQQALAALLSPMPALLGGRAPGLAVVILGALILGLIVALALRPRASAA